MSLCINPNCQKPSNADSNLYCQGCGSELVLMGRYRVIRLLSAKGGFGNTYEVLDKNVPKVLKVLINDHPQAVRLFQQEATVLKQLNHPGIPKGEGDFTYFPRNSQTPLHCLVMEKIEGIDLEEYIKNDNFKPIEQKLAIEWLFQLTHILGEVHRKNFFHRDIKPSNIILKPSGQLVLIDFGAARRVTETILAGKQNTQIYTSGYAPPEQEKGYALQQSDFFALGRTFVYLLTGKDPSDRAIYDYYNNELKWRKYAPHISHQLADFIDELMAEKANQRPANTAIILKRLDAIVQELLNSKKSSRTSQNKKPTSLKNSQISSQYAGFWLRLQASLIDRAIVMSTAIILSGSLSVYLYQKGIFQQFNYRGNLQWLVFISAFSIAIGTTGLSLLIILFGLVLLIAEPTLFLRDSLNIIILINIFLGLIINWLYFILLESSWLKTTIGKAMVGIIVTDEEGDRISLTQANLRYWGKLLSILTLYIGFMSIGWTKKKRALHDMLARTVVLKK